VQKDFCFGVNMNPPKKIYCRKCGARVKNDFQSKWNHCVKKHQEFVTGPLASILYETCSALRPYQWGTVVGDVLKKGLS
jgi:hypothetical protein